MALAAAASIAALVLGAVTVTSSGGRTPRTSAPSSSAGDTRTYEVTGFTDVEISGGIKATIVRGDRFVVKATAPKSLLHEVRVSTSRAMLVVQHSGRIPPGKEILLQVELPALYSLAIHNAVSARLAGWTDSVPRTVRADNAADLTGTLSASTLQLIVSNAAAVTLTGLVQTLNLTASNAVTLRLAELTAVSATLTISNASEGSCTVSGVVTQATVSGGSTLTISGGSRIDSRQVDSSSVLTVQ